jgi:hypothetical protein
VQIRRGFVGVIATLLGDLSVSSDNLIPVGKVGVLLMALDGMRTKRSVSENAMVAPAKNVGAEKPNT